MVKFKQPIRQGQSGRDVKAVKLGMVAMHVGGSGSMITRGTRGKFAGESFIKCLKRVQRNHNLHQDGVYGPKTHAIIAPHFNAYARWLYTTAKKRQPQHPPVPTTAIGAAKRLLELHSQGKWVDDRGTGLGQLQATAAGRAVWSPMGRYVHLNAKMLEALVWLIDVKGFKIGTFAFCSDHRYDGPHGHAGGYAVDIDSINGVHIGNMSNSTTVVQLLRDFHSERVPWQLISGGFGYRIHSDCQALTIPSAGFYGSVTMSQHTNHVHVGYI